MNDFNVRLKITNESIHQHLISLVVMQTTYQQRLECFTSLLQILSFILLKLSIFSQLCCLSRWKESYKKASELLLWVRFPHHEWSSQVVIEFVGYDFNHIFTTPSKEKGDKVSFNQYEDTAACVNISLISRNFRIFS